MNIKKFVITLFWAGSTILCFTFAQDSSSGYKDVIVKEEFNFNAYLKEWGKVYMTWNSVSTFTDSSLKYYKVVRSNTNTNPTYPEDGYIQYSEDRDWFTSYTDEKAPKWTNYYRICAIMQDNNRYCSSVKTITVADIWNAAETVTATATGTNEDPTQYGDVITESKFNFLANLKDDGKVYMSWIPISKFNDKNFKFYKIVRSSTNANLRYPEDGYIKYSEDKDWFMSYIDENPPSGTNYYRICAIMQDNSRFCSEVKKVEITKSTWKTFTNQETNTGSTNSNTDKNITPKAKQTLDAWVANYIKKLNEKYWQDLATINSKIQSTISKLEELKKSKTYLSKYIDYIIEKLGENTWLQDVSNILNEI